MAAIDIWPVDYLVEYKRRLKWVAILRNDPGLRDAAMLHYKHNPIDWINDWCVTFDPRKVDPDPRLMPFVLFQRQREFVTFLQGCLADKQSGLVEKARDIGASWLACAFSAWLWVFHPGSVIGWGSRKEEYVDKKADPKAILPKIRQILDYLPAFMMPAGYDPFVHATFMRILNPVNGSVITGEAGDNIGRGGRTTIYFKDESAHYEHPEMIEAALGDNTDVQIDISSVNGSANVFFRRRMAGQVWEPDTIMEPGRTRVFIFDWRDHPGKTQEWYDLRRKKAEDEGLLHVFAQEVDRDYSGSQERIIIPAPWVRAAIDAHVKLGITATGERIAGQDIADGGGDKNALAIRHGVVMLHASAWGGEAGDAPAHAIPICLEHNVRELFYDSIGVGAGFKTAANTMELQGTIPRGLKVLQWNAAASPQDPEDPSISGDAQSPTNEDQYGNLKAQAWFRLRARFSKTYRAVTKGEPFDPGEIISLPSDMENLHVLTMELSQAVYKTSATGKTIVDKQPDGSRSPNIADAVVMCFNPVRGPVGWFDLS